MKNRVILLPPMPESKDEFGRWLERHGGNVEINCVYGKYGVTVSWRKVRSYSDEKGSHVEQWDVSRYGPDFSTTLKDAIQAAVETAAFSDECDKKIEAAKDPSK